MSWLDDAKFDGALLKCHIESQSQLSRVQHIEYLENGSVEETIDTTANRIFQ